MKKGNYRVTWRAQEDLKSIGRYTLHRWGRKQRDTYLKSIDDRFAWLAKNPQFGKPRYDVNKGYYSYLEGSHVIFYLVHNHGIDIIGVPHQNMDILNYFE